MGIAENMDIQQYMATVGEQARGASRAMARATTGEKNAALGAIAAASAAARGAAGAPEGPATVEDDASRPRAVVSAPMPLETSSSRYA